MAEKKNIVERRKDRRYKAVEGAYAAISPHSHKIGQITDISMGGLCFKYIDTSDGPQDNELNEEKTLFLSSVAHYVENLPFRTTSDYEVTGSPSFSSLQTRKRHIQFVDLTPKQMFDIEYYLRNNVSEQTETPPRQSKIKIT